MFNLKKKAQNEQNIFYFGYDTNDKNSFQYEYITSDFDYAASLGRYVYKLEVFLNNPWTTEDINDTKTNDWVQFYEDLEKQGYDGVKIVERDGSVVVVPFNRDSVKIIEIINNLPEEAKV
jgi:hypothetical protein